MLKLIRFGLATACVAFGLQAATIPEILQEVDGKWELMASRILPVDGKVAQALAAKYTCLTCHNPDTKLVGPAYRDIAARYQDDGEAMAKVLGQIEKGGRGDGARSPCLRWETRSRRRIARRWVSGSCSTDGTRSWRIEDWSQRSGMGFGRVFGPGLLRLAYPRDDVGA